MLVTRQPILRVQRSCTSEPVPRAPLFPTPMTQVAVYKETDSGRSLQRSRLRAQFTKKQTQGAVYKETDCIQQ